MVDRSLRDLLQSRHSCRAFRPEPVPRMLIDEVLDLARLTPSWCNTQPWHVVITEGSGTELFRKALSGHAATHEMNPDFAFPERYDGELRERRKTCAMQLYDSVGIERGDRAASAAQADRNFMLFDAPHVAVVTSECELGTYGAVDTGLYVQSFLLAAESLGIGAVPQAALAGHAGFIRSWFDLPASRAVVCGVSFGWPDREAGANFFRTARRPVEDTVTWWS